jgi:hypothetical protein
LRLIFVSAYVDLLSVSAHIWDFNVLELHPRQRTPSEARKRGYGEGSPRKSDNPVAGYPTNFEDDYYMIAFMYNLVNFETLYFMSSAYQPTV